MMIRVTRSKCIYLQKDAEQPPSITTEIKLQLAPPAVIAHDARLMTFRCSCYIGAI
ncbi:MAG: hypothetical protein OXR07_03495 [Nitrospira sp.]|nr:hypothetical protein [Nitrospira sp.]